MIVSFSLQVLRSSEVYIQFQAAGVQLQEHLEAREVREAGKARVSKFFESNLEESIISLLQNRILNDNVCNFGNG